MKIIGTMLVRNEKDRWLWKCMLQMGEICDKLLVLDDASDDGTYEELMNFQKNSEYDLEIFPSIQSLWGKNELQQRQRLWNYAVDSAEENDWIICLDADELFVNDHIDYVKYLLNTLSIGIDAIGFRLHDMWSETHFRDDKLWTAHNRYWPMAIRYKKRTYNWIDRPLHCGRFPMDAAKYMCPTMIPIKHMGWSRHEDRQKKYDRYMSIDPKGENGMLAQYNSILDKSPNLIKFFE